MIPPWTIDTALALAREVQKALRDDPRKLFQNMYGNSPDEWSDSLQGMDRLRFTINVLTRVRVCTAEGRIDLKMKGGPNKAKPPFRPWFEFDQRKSRETRLIFGSLLAAPSFRAVSIAIERSASVLTSKSVRREISILKDCRIFETI